MILNVFPVLQVRKNLVFHEEYLAQDITYSALFVSSVGSLRYTMERQGRIYTLVADNTSVNLVRDWQLMGWLSITNAIIQNPHQSFTLGLRVRHSPLDRQIDESLRIKYSEAAVIMNSGSEWRSDPIPRARVAKSSRPL